MNPFELLVRSQATLFALECVRLGGLVMVAPLAWSSAPARAKVALVLLLAVAAHGQGQLPAGFQGSLERTAFAVGSELLLGVAIGLVVRVAVAAVEIAAEQIALMMGLGIAQLFDPQINTTHNVLSVFLRNFALLIALAVGLHRDIIAITIGSFREVPVGSVVGVAGYGPTFMTLGGQVLETGLRLSMPIFAVLLMTQIALAFISRAAPAIQIFSIGFAVTLGVGFFVLAVTLPELAREIGVEFSRVETRIEELLANAAAGQR